jgi:hypothetical protein
MNGMERYVCVHDFSIASFNEEETENEMKATIKLRGPMVRIGSTLDRRRN